MKKRLIFTSLISIVLIVVLMVGSTYSLFVTSNVDDDLNVYKTGNLDVTYTVSDNNEIYSSSIPVSSSDADRVKPYRITVNNVGNVPYKFNIILNNVTATNSVDSKYVVAKVGKLEPKTLDNCDNGIIKGDVIVPAGESAVIDVRVYLNETIENTEIGKSFHANLSIDGIAIYNENNEIDNSILMLSKRTLVRHNANGGIITKGEESKELESTSKYGDFPTVERVGYTFSGWYTEEGVQVTSDSDLVIEDDHTLMAKWNANSYTVTFDANEGTVTPTSKSVVYDKEYGELPTPTKENNVFVGWFTEISGGKLVTSTSDVIRTENHTLYARWTNDCVVIFDANKGDVEPSSIIVREGEAYGSLPTPIRGGYEFAGWYTGVTGGEKVTESTIVNTGVGTDGKTCQPHTLYAHWSAKTYTVSYVLNYIGNSETAPPASKTVTYDELYGSLATVTRDGYIFEGWYSEPDGGTKIESSSKVVALSDHTLYAHWNTGSYTITFDDNDNDASTSATPTSKTVFYGGAYGELAEVGNRTGYTFLGWYTSKSGGSKVTETTEVNISSPHTLYAHWSANSYTNTLAYSLTGFKNNEGNDNGIEYRIGTSTYVVSYGTKFKMRDKNAAVIPNGYYERSFGSTSLSSDGSWKSYSLDDEITQPANGIWAEYYFAPFEYNITYELDGGVNNADNPSTYNVLYGVTLMEPTRTGYTFEGWYIGNTKVTGINEGCNATFTSADDIYEKLASRTTGDVTLTAKWTPNVLTVIYHSNGATKITLNGSEITEDYLVNNLVSTYKYGTTYSNGVSDGDSSWLYLTKTGHTFSKYWLVGSADSNIKIYEYDSYTAQSLAEAMGTSLNDGSKTVHLYAEWLLNTYTVTLNANGGSVSQSSIEVTFGNTYGSLPTPTLDGYGFAGWYTEQSGGTKIESSTIVSIPSAHTLYAHWGDNTAPTVHDISGGTSLKDQSPDLTLKCTDNVGVTAYYWGTTEPTVASSITTTTASDLTALTGSGLTKTITAEGTYWLGCRDAAGKYAKKSITIRKYVVNNLLETIAGTTGTYTSANYTSVSTGTYYIKDGEQLTLTSIYTIPTGSASGKFKGYSTSYSTTAVTPSTTNPTVATNDTTTYYMWFNRNTYNVTVSKPTNGTVTAETVTKTGNSVTASSAAATLTVKYGDTVKATATPSTGYSFTEWSGGYVSGTENPVTGGTVSAAKTITASFGDSSSPSTPTINRSDYNTFTYSATDNVAVTGYYVSTSSTTPTVAEPQSTFALNAWTTATNTGNLTLSEGQSYYVWARDAVGRISSSSASIAVRTITRSQGTGTTLTTRYGATTETSGTVFTSSNVKVLDGTPIWAKATEISGSGYGSVTLKHGSTSMTASGDTFNATASETIASSATYNATPTIEVSDCDTFTYSATGASAYYVSTSSTTPSAGSTAASSTFALDTWTTATSTGNLTIGTSAATYYVWAKNATTGGTVSQVASKSLVKVTRSVGTGSTLTTRYNSTSSSTGTEFTSSSYVLPGSTCSVWAQASASDGYESAVLKRGGSTVDNPSYASVTGAVTIASSATYNATCSISRFDYNTFTYGATGAGAYYISTSSTTPSAGSSAASSTFALDTWTTATSTGNLTLSENTTYYVWAKSATTGGVVSSNNDSIAVRKITRTQGTGTILTTRYDYDEINAGVTFTNTQLVLSGTTIWASSTASSGYRTATLKMGGTSKTASGDTATATANMSIVSAATANVVKVNIYKDGAAWSASEMKVTLYNGTTSTSYTATVSSGSQATISGVPNGTYNIYAGKNSLTKTTLLDSGVDVTVNDNSPDAVTINYYTLTLVKGTGVYTVSQVSQTSTLAVQHLYNSSSPQFIEINAALYSGYNWSTWTKTAGTNLNTFTAGTKRQDVKMGAGATTLTASAIFGPPTITISDHNTFAYEATAGKAYYVSTSSTKPSAGSTAASSTFALDTWTTATSTGNLSLSKGQTYYVWAKSLVTGGNVSSNYASIAVREITRTQGTGTTLTTKYNSSTGTEFTGTAYVLNGTTIWASSTASSGYRTATLKMGGTSKTASGDTATATANMSVVSAATANVVKVNIYKDGAAWSASGMKVTLYNGTTSTSYTATVSSGSQATISGVPNGTYNIYAGKNSLSKATLLDSDVDVTVNNNSPSAVTINYYTLTLVKGTGISTVSQVSQTSTLAVQHLYNSSSPQTSPQTIEIDATMLSGYNWSTWTKTSGTNLTFTAGTKRQSIKMGAGATTLTASATFGTPTITTSDYNTFTYAATAGKAYYVSTDSTKPSAGSTAASSTFALNKWTTATSTGNLTLTSGETYYVWAKSATTGGVVSSNKASIAVRTIKRSQGTGTTLTTKYDYNANNSGTVFTSTLLVLNGTVIWAEAVANSDGLYGGAVLKHGSTTMNSYGESFTVNASETITSSLKTYYLTYDCNGATNSAFGQVCDGSSLSLKYMENGLVSPDVPILSGYGFAGWSTDKNGAATYKPDSNIQLSSDVTLYAVWDERSYSVSSEWYNTYYLSSLNYFTDNEGVDDNITKLTNSSDVISQSVLFYSDAGVNGSSQSIDLNGKKFQISSSTANEIIRNRSNLIIKNSTNNYSALRRWDDGKNLIANESGATLDINDVYLECYGNGTVISNAGVLNVGVISGGSRKEDSDPAVSYNENEDTVLASVTGYAIHSYSPGVVNHYAGAYSYSGGNYTIFNSSGATLNLYGGRLYYYKSGSTGAAIEGTGTKNTFNYTWTGMSGSFQYYYSDASTTISLTNFSYRKA